MIHLSWAIYVEGSTDVEYFSILLRRLIEDIVINSSGPDAQIPEQPIEIFGVSARSHKTASDRICAAKDSFFLLFVHGDTGGRSQEARLGPRVCGLCDDIAKKCNFQRNLCIIVAPKHETEAWCLADKTALRTALGLANNFRFENLAENPWEVERLVDPKATATTILGLAAGRRRAMRPVFPYASLAQEQSLTILRQIPSFRTLEDQTRGALRQLGYPQLQE